MRATPSLHSAQRLFANQLTMNNMQGFHPITVQTRSILMVHYIECYPELNIQSSQHSFLMMNMQVFHLSRVQTGTRASILDSTDNTLITALLLFSLFSQLELSPWIWWCERVRRLSHHSWPSLVLTPLSEWLAAQLTLTGFSSLLLQVVVCLRAVSGFQSLHLGSPSMSED